MSNSRLNQVRSIFPQYEIDALLIESAENYRWLSGFTGSACSLMITQAKALLGTDFRYWEQAEKQAPDFELVRMSRTDKSLASIGDLFKMSDALRIGIEANKVTLVDFAKYEHEAAEAGLEGIQFVPIDGPIDLFRDIKSEAELEMMKKAAAITDQAMRAFPEFVKVGISERQLAWELEKMMRELGADGVAFDIIVASGPNAAMAHHRPGDRTIEVDDPIIVDMGALLNGYHSDLTRSFIVCKKGSTPDSKFEYVYNLVHTAQKNALENMNAGMTGKEIDRLARDVIEDAGHGENFGHSLGHGVGLEIHESPSLSSRNEEEVQAGSVVTVEPGVYLSGWGGVRIEDLVVLGENGPTFLSSCPKEPIIFVD